MPKVVQIHVSLLKIILCEPIVPPVEPLFDSVIKTCYKLQELGITDVDGKIVFVDDMEAKP